MPIEFYQSSILSPCRAVYMTIKQLGLDIDIKDVNVSEDEHLAPEFIKMNPAHCVPALNDNGFVLWESRAIMQYLCNEYAPNSSLYPKDTKKRAVVDQWLNFDMTIYTNQSAVIWSKFVTGADASEDKVTAFKKNLDLLDQLIGNSKYLTGNDLTLADLSMLATLSYADMVNYDLSPYKNVERWRSTLKKEVDNYDAINVFSEQEVKAVFDNYLAKLAKQAKK